jgi:hypothetical protein
MGYGVIGKGKGVWPTVCGELKTEDRKKAEIRSTEFTASAAEWQLTGSSHTRISGFGLLSGFELRASAFRAAGHPASRIIRVSGMPAIAGYCTACPVRR